MPLPDWHPEKWQYYEHTRVKHEILRKYLKSWTYILGGFYEKICYFDCFAGRGEYNINNKTEVGSPIIAIRTAKDIEDKYKQFLMIFIEKDPDNFKNLIKKLEEEDWDKDKIQIFVSNGSFSEEIGRILNALERAKANPYPSFFFIDPFGFSDIPSELIGNILSYKRTEIFFTFMARDINRFIESEKHEKALNTLFWNEDWKQIVNKNNREKALVKLYENQLKEFGGAKYTLSFRVCMDDMLRTAYYLIHASNHFKAFKLMKDIVYNQSHGKFGFFGPIDKTQSVLQFLDYEASIKEFLLQRFNGKTIKMIHVMEECYMNTPFIKKHIWRALKKMESEGLIKMYRLGPHGGYRDDAIVVFS